MKISRRILRAAFLFTVILMTSCTDDDDENVNSNEMMDFTTTPSTALQGIVSNTPSDFTWDFYEDNLTIGLEPLPESFNGEIVLSAFRVSNGQVTNNSTSSPVATDLSELANGLSTEDMYPGSQWITENDWLPGNDWTPTDVWYPGSMWAPSEIESIAMAENTLADNQTMVVVYPELAIGSDDREQVSQPYGIIFENQADPMDFTTTPSTALQGIISNTPSDFTWGFYEDNLTIGLEPLPESFNGEIVLSAFRVSNGQVTNNSTSSPVATDLSELANGLSTEDMYPGSQWITENDWLPGNDWTPTDVWYPGSMWAPSEIESIAMAENTLADNETMVVVYPELAVGSDDRVQVSQPYGIIFEN